MDRMRKTEHRREVLVHDININDKKLKELRVKTDTQTKNHLKCKKEGKGTE